MTAIDLLVGEHVVRDTPQAVADEVAGWIAETAKRAIDDHGHFSIALAGGSTPRLLYQTLAQPASAGNIEWDAWRVYFGDERACRSSRDAVRSLEVPGPRRRGWPLCTR